MRGGCRERGCLPAVSAYCSAVLTEIKAIRFADEIVRLGEDFMDAYEDPLIHRQNEQI